MINKLLAASLLFGFYSTSVFSQTAITAIDDEFCAENVVQGTNDVYNIYDNDSGSGYWFSGGTVNSTEQGGGWFEGGGVRLFVSNAGAGPFAVTGNYCITNGTESCADFVINAGGDCSPGTDDPDDLYKVLTAFSMFTQTIVEQTTGSRILTLISLHREVAGLRTKA